MSTCQRWVCVKYPAVEYFTHWSLALALVGIVPAAVDGARRASENVAARACARIAWINMIAVAAAGHALVARSRVELACQRELLAYDNVLHLAPGALALIALALYTKYAGASPLARRWHVLVGLAALWVLYLLVPASSRASAPSPPCVARAPRVLWRKVKHVYAFSGASSHALAAVTYALVALVATLIVA